MTTQDIIGQWIGQLADQNPCVRESARGELVEQGGREVMVALTAELFDPREHVRWEAAKALQQLADPASAGSLANALDDEDDNVRWVAAEGLARLGLTGLSAVLQGLTKRAASVWFQKGAHHALHSFAEQGFKELLSPVLEALQKTEPGVSAPPAAFRALMQLKAL